MNLLLSSSSSSSSLRRKVIAALVSTFATTASISGGSTSGSNNSNNNNLASAMSFPLTTSTMKIIDSHLHVWASSSEALEGFPYCPGNEPPPNLQDKASVDQLLKQMDDNNVAGAVIIQPINHKFDHSYVGRALKQYPDRFKGMLLLDPTLSPSDALEKLDELVQRQKFCGVRFNPYLWPPKVDSVDDGNNECQWQQMSTPGGTGVAVYKRCAELQIPVGIMCFQGLPLHYEDILKLLKMSPGTKLIIDHFGFAKLPPDADSDSTAFDMLLKLASHPQVYVKISALFRLDDVSPYNRVRSERFEPLLKAFGPDRLMFGTDFPFVLEQEPERYGGMVNLVSSWMDGADDAAKAAVMGKTAETLFGSWGIDATADTTKQTSP